MNKTWGVVLVAVVLGGCEAADTHEPMAMFVDRGMLGGCPSGYTDYARDADQCVSIAAVRRHEAIAARNAASAAADKIADAQEDATRAMRAEAEKTRQQMRRQESDDDDQPRSLRDSLSL